MTKKELVKGLSYLGTALGKEYSKEECEVFYDFLKDYDYSIFVEAIKSRIKSSSFLPKVNELIEECEKCKKETNIKIVDVMKQNGYFKSPVEYEKTIGFIKAGVIPSWLQQDMNKFYNLENKKQIESVSSVKIQTSI